MPSRPSDRPRRTAASRGRRYGVAVCVVLAAAVGAGSGPARASTSSARAAPTRYSLASGCYSLRSLALGQLVGKSAGGYRASGDVAPEVFRMQATQLGRYLLYGSRGDFLALGSQNDVVSATAP